MTAIILRRRKLGSGSSAGIVAASTKGIQAVRNWMDADWQGLGGICDPLTVFRWGCTSTVPGQGTQSPISYVNTAASIHWCSDKRQGRLDMQAAGVSVPETWSTDDPLVHRQEGKFVLRPIQHAQGKHLYVFRQDMAIPYDGFLVRKAAELGGGYVSRLIDKVAEYRVFVCSNRAVWVARKTPGNPDQVAWNVAQGGRFDNVRWGDWPMAVIKEAIHAAKVSKTDFCGVDVMVDADGKAYVLEVNSAPSQTSEYRQKCVAKAFDYIIENGKDMFPDPDRFRSYKNVIHPALTAEQAND